MRLIVLLGLVLVMSGAGCGQKSSGPAIEMPPQAASVRHTSINSDPAAVKAADYSMLFVGNSHTAFHNMPDTVCKMIEHRHPGKKAYAHVVFVTHLDAVPTTPLCQEELKQPWKFVILQAQKISESGRYNYSRQEGIDYAKKAREKGATVYFFSEWGRKGIKGEGPKYEKIYREMADKAGVNVVPVARAWDLALAERPDLPLHEADGDHESPLGAFLTACVFYGYLTGESPGGLADFPHNVGSAKDRAFLANAAARAFAKRNAKE